MQPGGYLKLKELGLDACVAGIDAQAVKGYALFKGGDCAKIAYPTDGFAGDVAGRSFHNGRFVQRLREAAAAAPGVTVRAGMPMAEALDAGMVRACEEAGYLEWQGGRLCATAEGRLRLDAMLPRILL